MFNRGYTTHSLSRFFFGKHLDEFALINIACPVPDVGELGNGRVYDLVLARFLSPDPVIQNPENTQSHNRYSYVVNNPMKYTDPSGYILDGLFDAIFAPIDFIAPAIYFGLNGLTLPARALSEPVFWVNNKINGSTNPNGYFNLNYMLTGYRPVPYGFDISQNSNFYAPGPRGGFVSADGTFHDNNDIAQERMEYFLRHIEQEEEGDFNYMTSKEFLSMVGINQGVFTTGQDYVTDDPPAANEKEGSDGDDLPLHSTNSYIYDGHRYSIDEIFMLEAGQHVRVELTNMNILGVQLNLQDITTYTYEESFFGLINRKVYTGDSHSMVLLPGQTQSFDFYRFDYTPQNWWFQVGTSVSDAANVRLSFYSD
jgi:hypothetical protein